MGKTTRTMLAALTAATVLTACAGGSDDDPTGEATSSSASSSASGTGQQTESSGSDGDSELDEAAAEAGVDPTDPPEPIASVTMPGAGGGANNTPTEITLDLLSLRRDGDLLVLNLGFTPKEGKPTSYYGWTTTSWSPRIIDTTNLTVHEVVSSGEESLKTDTSPIGTRVGGGQTLHLYAVFAAPPEDVSTVTVKPADGAPAFTGVTIQ